MTISLYLVGGAVRDYLRDGSVQPKDFDFAVEAPSFDAMCDYLESSGFRIFLKTPEYFTVRARLPYSWSFAGFEMSGLTYDFVLCRKDGHYSDGRRPDEVEAGSIFDDLARRDFTMNAIAIDENGLVIDPHEGMEDIEFQYIQCVGDVNRLREDPLRILRALRFSIQLGFTLSDEIDEFLVDNSDVFYMLTDVSVDRIRDELTKCFKISATHTFFLLNKYPYIMSAVLEGAIWLKPTTEKK